jgi:putative membrane protein (TIGR04086 family)
MLATAVGGYIAGTLARESQAFNGFMVGVVGIVLFAILSGNLGGSPAARIYVLTQIMGCMLGMLGGYLSQLRAQLR